ncbi:MAG TPA: tRNA dihydrouridine(20/20a) synthase DusA [Pseudomonadales bacterium]|nr:tRNA dihydrouridine(20/20a) synthase DusA [Pseudomonadales bacterium]
MNTVSQSPWKLCVAPMMEWTDRHCRHFHRLLAPHARLYTEMVSCGALLHGPRARLLAYSAEQHPLALQLGGADPRDLAASARFGAAAGFDEINLNVGCPSDRVQHARIGACLMREPDLVADCVRAMRDAVDVPVTVKCRTGVDDADDYGFLAAFVDVVAAAGCNVFIVHARKAILTGLTPAQNRSIPPLDWTRVSRLKGDFPHLTFVVNGGLDTLDAVNAQLERVDGVMLGRAAYHDPWGLHRIDTAMFDGEPLRSRRDALLRLLPYVDAELGNGARLHDIARHLHGVFNGCAGARRYRRHLAEHATRPGADVSVLLDAAQFVVETHGTEALAECSNA